MRKIIVLKKLESTGWKAQVAYWASVPLSIQKFYANPTAMTQVGDASQAELGAIRDGSVREQITTVTFEVNTTQEVIDANLIAGWTTWQAIVTGDNSFTQYGRNWDGSTWNDPAVIV